jgi:hypothetical protein
VVSARAAALTKGVLTSMFVTKLRTTALWLLAVAVVGTGMAVGTYPALAGGPGAARADDAPNAAAEDAKKDKDVEKETDKDKLQGAWVPVAVVTDGKKRFAQAQHQGKSTQLRNVGCIRVSEQITTARRPSVKYGSPVRLCLGAVGSAAPTPAT